MSRKDSGNFIKIVDDTVETSETANTDIRKHHSLIHGMNNFHVSPIRRKRASSFKKPKTHSPELFGHLGEMRPRTCSMPTRNTFRKPGLGLLCQGHHVCHLDVDTDIYRLRSFSTTSKGIVINKGDSVRSRSTNSVYSSGSEEFPLSPSSGNSSTHSRECFGMMPVIPFRVTVLGAAGVGKTAITQQFMTSEYLGGFDTSIGE